MDKLVRFQMMIKSAEVKGDALKIEGYASTNDVDRYNDIVQADAWNDPEATKSFLANPILLLSHNHDKAIGVVNELTSDDKGLYVVAEVRNDIDSVKKNLVEWTTRCFSIGFIVKAMEFRTKDGKNISELSQEEMEALDSKDVLRIITKLELVELSVVNVPANPAAIFTVQKALKEFFDELETKNADDADIGEEEEAVVEDTTPEQVETPEEKVDEVEEGETPTAEEDQKPEEKTIDEEIEVKQATLQQLEVELEAKQADIEWMTAKVAELEAKVAQLAEKVRTTPKELVRINSPIVEDKKGLFTGKQEVNFYNPKN